MGAFVVVPPARPTTPNRADGRLRSGDRPAHNILGYRGIDLASSKRPELDQRILCLQALQRRTSRLPRARLRDHLVVVAFRCIPGDRASVA